MPKAKVTFLVSYEVEVSDALMARMLDSSDEGMGPFYPSENREEAWEKLGRWLGLEKWNVSGLDGIADFSNNDASARQLECELDEVEEY